MIVVGVSMVKDEADIIETTVRHMLSQVDAVLILDDNSTDGTYEILKSIGGDINDPNRPYLSLIHDDGIDGHWPRLRKGYYQSEKMTLLANEAREMFRADWIIPFDADEIWTSEWGTLKEVCESNADTYGIIKAELFDHVCTGKDNPNIVNPVQRIFYRRRESLPFPKVACRATKDLIIEQGNHWARYSIPVRPTEECPIVVHHYPYRSVEQVIHKVRNGAAAYALTDLPENVGAHWRQWGKFSDSQIKELFYEWYYDQIPDPKLIQDRPNVATVW